MSKKGEVVIKEIQGESREIIYKRVVYSYRREWPGGILEGEIPDVLAGVCVKTDEVLFYPPEASKTIKAWIDSKVEEEDITFLKKEHNDIKKEMCSLRTFVDNMTFLGLMDDYGWISDDHATAVETWISNGKMTKLGEWIASEPFTLENINV